MGVEENRQAVLSHFERFNQHDWAVIEEVAAQGFVDHEEIPGFSNDAAGTRQRLEYMGQAFPDLHFEPLDVIADQRQVAIRLRMTGTHQGEFMGMEATGRRIDWEAVDVLAFNDAGQVTDHWGYGDILDLLQQLGALPPLPELLSA